MNQAGQQVTAGDAGHNGAISAGGSTTFGMVVDGPERSPSDVSCEAQ